MRTIISLSVAPEIAADLHVEAAAAGLPLSTYAVRLIAAGRRNRAEVLADVLAEMLDPDDLLALRLAVDRALYRRVTESDPEGDTRHAH